MAPDSQSTDAVHRIVAEGSNREFKVSNLIELQQAAKEKGVKLAIVDESCYSGETQRLADGHTYIISASAATSLAYAGFATRFGRALVPGKSLEQTFLEVRAVANSPSAPEINGEAGSSARDLVRKLRLALSASPSVMRLEDKDCGPFSETAFRNNILNIGKFITSSFGASVNDINSLDKSLTNYLSARQDATRMAAIGDELIRFEGLIYSKLVLAQLDKFIEFARLDRSPPDSSLATFCKDLIKDEPVLKARRAQALRDDPDFQLLVEEEQRDRSGFSPIERRLFDAANEVFKWERKIYDAEYRRVDGAGSASPCRGFIL